MIKFDLNSYMVDLNNYSDYESKIKTIKRKLETDSNMTDWYDLNKCVSNDVITDIIETSNYIKTIVMFLL